MKTILELKTWLSTVLTGKPAETTQETPGQETPSQETPGETPSQETPEGDAGQETPEGDAGQETPGETPSQETPEEITARLDARENELLQVGTQLQTLTETLNQREADLNTRETALADRETKLTEKEKTTGALAAVVGNVTTPVKPENTAAGIVAAYQAETNPSKRAAMFRKHRKEILAATKRG